MDQLTKPTNRGREQRKGGEKKSPTILNRTQNIQDVAVSDRVATKWSSHAHAFLEPGKTISNLPCRTHVSQLMRTDVRPVVSFLRHSAKKTASPVNKRLVHITVPEEAQTSTLSCIGMCVGSSCGIFFFFPRIAPSIAGGALLSQDFVTPT